MHAPPPPPPPPRRVARPTDWHVEHRDNGAPTANGMVATGGREGGREEGGRAGIISFPSHNGADQNRAITYVFYSADRGGEIEEERRGGERDGENGFDNECNQRLVETLPRARPRLSRGNGTPAVIPFYTLLQGRLLKSKCHELK